MAKVARSSIPVRDPICTFCLRQVFHKALRGYIYGGFLKQGYPQIIHFSRTIPYKPSILGYPHLWKHPYMFFTLCQSNAKFIDSEQLFGITNWFCSQTQFTVRTKLYRRMANLFHLDGYTPKKRWLDCGKKKENSHQSVVVQFDIIPKHVFWKQWGE